MINSFSLYRLQASIVNENFLFSFMSVFDFGYIYLLSATLCKVPCSKDTFNWCIFMVQHSAMLQKNPESKTHQNTLAQHGA